MTKKSIPYSNLKRLSILGLICVLLLSLMVFAACEEEEEEAYTLIIAVSPAGSGTTSPAAGTYVYDEGDVVTITATAATGYEFVNWSGASGTSATTSVTMTSNKTVTANFEAEAAVEYTLTMAVTPTGGGTTTPTVAGSPHTYDEDTEVTVTATPATGYEFVSWSANVVDGEVTMDADKTVTANFVEVTGPAIPAVGTVWEYECTYGTIETTTWTYTVTGLASAGTEAWAATGPPGDVPAYVLTGDCYITEVSYSAPPARTTKDIPAVISGSTNWVSQTTLDNEATFASIELYEMPVATYMTNTYTGNHGWDFSVNTAWSYVSAGMLDPPLSADFSNEYNVAVTGTEDVTVTAGMFTCYHITYTKVATDGAPVTPVLGKEEWWCPDISGLVKSINYTMFDEIESLELQSTTA